MACYDDLSFDAGQLLCSVQSKLGGLTSGALEAVIHCIESCGQKWDILETDDADYFKDHEKRRHSEATLTFIWVMGHMILSYLEVYRQSTKAENTQNSINNKSPQHTVKIEWLHFLHETRCPICFCRFSDVQPVTNAPNR